MSTWLPNAHSPAWIPISRGILPTSHSRFVTYASDALQDRLPPGLRARMQKRVIVSFADEDPPVTRDIYPDSYISGRGNGGGGTAVLDSPAATQPVVMEFGDEPMEQTYIEVTEASTGRAVITVVELLSPSNKASGDGMDQYRQKQRECRAGGVNLVEIDLLRGGRDVLIAPRNRFRQEHRQHYTACVYRPERWPKLEVYPISLRGPLPAIRIPLRAGRDADVVLDLQALFDKSYTNGAYDDTDYAAPIPPPPLSAEDQAWVAEWLSEAGRL